MNKIEALKMICTGVEALIAIEEGSAPIVSAPAPSENKDDVPAPAVEKEEVPAVETVPTEEVASYAPMSEETLKGMGYADLKALAKNVGVSAKGTKSQLLKVLIEYFKNMDEETPVEAPPQEEVPQEEVPQEETPADEAGEEVADGEDTRAVVLRMIEENEMSDDDIREVLKDAGLSDKGKHEALIDKLVSAIDDGIIQLEDEEDDEPAPVEEEAEEEESDEPAITPERAKGIKKLMEEVDEQFKDGSLTASDIREFLDQFGDVTIPKKASADKLLELYKENVSMLVDDEGNVCEEGAYFINNVPYCCGRPLNVADDNTATCSVCGETYEFEEE